jgi:guanosine-3',5'-bis(diphosphate) 3'-pyrophosphohydrolase
MGEAERILAALQGQDDLTFLLHVLAFAAWKHHRQRRNDADQSAYINHPIALACLLAGCGIKDRVTLAAALLRDTIEDTDATEPDLRAVFGNEITDTVLEVTDDKALKRADRKRLQIEHAARLSQRAKLVKLADNICNLRDVTYNPPLGWSLEQKREYFDWAKAVVNQMRGTHERLEALFDVEYAQRP